MENSHEYELKIMLSEKEYRELILYDGEDPYIQTNYYFDTPGFDMYAKHIVIRVRKKKDICELTVKTKNHDETEAGVISMNENTIILDEEEAEEILKGKLTIGMYLTFFPGLQDKDFKNIGHITTIRKNIVIDEHMPMAEIDKNIYAGISDYELEWEIDESKYIYAIKKLGQMGLFLEGRATGQSKYGRLVSSILEGDLK